MSEDSNPTSQTTVVPINGDVVLPGRAAEDVIASIRDLLAEAERGEVFAFACATVDAGGNAAVRWSWQGQSVDGFALMGAVSRLQHRLNEACDE